MHKQDYSKYFGGKNGKNKKTPKEIAKVVWGWVKVVIFIFVIISMLWGCIQMYQPNYTVGQVNDMAGNSIFSPGVSFEIIIKSLSDSGYKTHWFTIGADGIVREFQFKAITSWGRAFSETGGSLFYGFFVYPLAFILVGFIRLFSGVNEEGILDATKANYGVSALFAIFFTSLFVRGITLAFTWKTQLNQEKMTNMTAKQGEIQAKYKGSTDPAAKQKQQMELMALYKKEGISPLSSMATQLLSMPILFAMFSIVRSARVLKVTRIGEIALIEQPWAQITREGNWIYAAIIAVYLPLQVLSMLLPLILQMTNKSRKNMTEQQKKARKKQLIMQIVMIVVFFVIVASIASGVAIYWIFSSFFQIVQTLMFHFLRETKSKRIKRKREKMIKASKEKAAKHA